MSEFVHLHVHSHYSLLDGLPKIDELVATAKKRGFSALALTDHGNMYGAIEFYEACKKQEIKPIIGVEAYVAPVSRFEKNSSERYHHLVLLALNYTGYKNLLKLVSLASTEGFYYKPRMDKELLRQYHEGLVASTACFGGEIPRLLRAGNYEQAKIVALEYQEIFGVDNFYLELMDLPALEGQMALNDQLIALSKDTGIPVIVTRDVHYLDPEDSEAQDILTCIRDGRTLDDADRETLVGIDCSFAKANDIASRFKHIPEALSNTVKIAERVDLQLELNKWHFPSLNLPVGQTADDYLRELVYNQLPVLMEVTDEVKKRADYELDIIAKKGYSPYFLVVADYVKYAREHDIIETTRGSGAGSLVSYAMDITTVNPLSFKLPFERFLNPFRPSPPDIDADFADDRRDDMIAYVTEKYGADKVAQIITFGTMAARGAVRDVARALGYSYSLGDQVSKLIPFGAQGFQMTIAKALNLEPELKKIYNENPQVHRLLDLAQKIEGCARHTSMHAAGVVISPTPLTDFTPIQYETGGERIVTQYEMHAVEAAGLLKMDFLGIRNLSILGHAVEIVAKTTGQKINIFKLPLDDKKTYEMLARGETMGVFQLSGSGMTRYLKELKPTTIFDIMAMVALFRPGPMDQIPEYIRRKNHADLIEYLDPRMKDYLDQSLGLIVYQDDVLLTAINLGGYNWEEADKFRKAMGKKIPEEMAKQKDKFFKGCKEFGKLPEIKIHRLWEMIEPFAAYGFNKAHAASYGMVAYQTAYMKANYPVQYMTAVLIAESGDMDKVPEIIHECEKMGVKVMPPDINESFKNFAMVGWEDNGQAHIRFGLSGIKNLGEHIADVIYRERKTNGRYTSLEDLLRRVQDRDLNKKSLESLTKCGALDSFGSDRGLLLSNMDNLLSFAKQIEEQGKSNQNSLFTNTAIDIISKLRLEAGPEATEQEKLTWEKELLGLYITAHPFAKYQTAMQGVLTDIKDLKNQPCHSWVVVGGVIDTAKKKITRSGQAMMFVTLLDTTDSMELLVFPRTYETTKDVWVEGKMVCVVGRTSDDEEDDKLFVEKAYEISEENVAYLRQQLNVKNSVTTPVRQEVRVSKLTVFSDYIEINLTAAEVKAKAEAIKLILGKYKGEQAVYLIVGDKKIKTSFLVEASNGLIDELNQVL
ncbi:MAG: polymerase III, alpha subunit protein [Candidatus Magasanikbacteria bacterium GW2011_GWA2_37_8]|uniref:DNA polymerase III subunit alpha n=1 Tax=Candidatus Magasanikbacteria bacterium GW2011_GWA2_37_8 TaxID=1619036 RepID=A0A0G0HF25_9BACT|nr:MAG: polymerase III, alpha subunit protein [Candidatus Magasanikbacteria bacterium GW2011_GWA2_37_8]